jgi:hypothetical protein
MNRQPPLQRPHRNHIPDLLLHDHHHQKIHLRRRVRHLPHARPPRRPHRKPSMMRRRRPLHLHSPHLPSCIHNQVIFLVVPIRLRHHQPPPRGHHHKPHLRQIPSILAVTPSTRFPRSPIPFSHWPVSLKSCSVYVRTAALGCPPEPALSLPKGAARLRRVCRDERLRPSASSAAPLSPKLFSSTHQQKWRRARRPAPHCFFLSISRIPNQGGPTGNFPNNISTPESTTYPKTLPKRVLTRFRQKPPSPRKMGCPTLLAPFARGWGFRLCLLRFLCL